MADLVQYDITQLIKIKQDFKDLKLVILGGGEAPLVCYLPIECTWLTRHRLHQSLPLLRFQSSSLTFVAVHLSSSTETHLSVRR